MKPIAVISTDWHINTENVGLSKQLMTQQIQLAKKVGVRKLFCLGDIFDAQRSQTEIVLNCFEEILDMIQAADMKLIAIAGNHDKTNRYSWDSFLRPFSTHPAFHFIEESEIIRFNGDTFFYFQSYIKEPLWIERVKHNLSTKPDNAKVYLFSHQAMNGSVNNDGSKVESGINAGLLSNFEKCFFGHYHDAQQPCSNAFHLAAWKQKNFGENDEKGFYVLGFEGEELDTEFYPSESPKYITIDCNAQEIDEKSLLRLVNEENGNKYRLAVKGSLSELKSLSMAKFNELGIKVKRVEVENHLNGDREEVIVDYSKDDALKDAFKEFCEEKGFDFKEGLAYLELK